MTNWINEYIRLCCYALVFIISAVSIKFKRSQDTYVSDLIISSGLFFSVFGFLFTSLTKDSSRNIILTPMVILWTIFVFYKFSKK